MYEISCNDKSIKENYVGQTKNYRVRKGTHKCGCNNKCSKTKERKLYKFINENGGWDNWTMRPLEEIECTTHMQALIREQYWITEKQATLNREPTKGDKAMRA